MVLSLRKIDDQLARLAQLFDSQLDNVSGLQVLWGIHPQPNSCRSSGTYHIAREKRHELTHIGHERGNIEDHVRCGTLLAKNAIHLKPHLQISRIRNFRLRRQKRAKWSKSVRALSLHPLSAALQLKGPLGVVIV